MVTTIRSGGLPALETKDTKGTFIKATTFNIRTRITVSRAGFTVGGVAHHTEKPATGTKDSTVASWNRTRIG